MRILIVAHNIARGDGQARVNFELVRECIAQGHAVTMVAHRAASELTRLGARWAPVRLPVKRPILFKVPLFVAAADRMVRSMRSDFDVIVANGYVLREPHDVNVCHFVHGGWLKSMSHVAKGRRGINDWYQSQFTRINARWEKHAFAAARYVVAISNGIRRELMDVGVSDGKMRVICNGVDLQEFHPARDGQLRENFGLPAGVPLGVFVGDIRTTRKNLGTLLEAMVQVPAAHLAVVGGLKGSPFPKMAAELGIARRVHFLGYRRDVAQVLRACDFFVFPTRYEACALVTLEALSSGLPVITTRGVGAAAELISPECGILLDDPEDADALALAIKQLAESTQWTLLSQAARQVVCEHSWSKMAEAYLRLFQVARAKGPREDVPATEVNGVAQDIKV